jgi:spore coat polysaccharide biosynthesis protein SpsF (cytidylyltransferase family)
MGSERLPGKVLLPIAGKPMLQHVIDAAEGSKLIDRVIVATSTAPSDNPICRYLEGRYNQPVGKGYFRGSLLDVLDRFYQLASSAYLHATHIVRLTGDCPMLRPDIIDNTISDYLRFSADYARNNVDGVDVEVFPYSSLLMAHKLSFIGSDREHVTPFIKRRAKKEIQTHYGLGYSAGSVDTQEEYEIVKAIMEGRYGY